MNNSIFDILSSTEQHRIKIMVEISIQIRNARKRLEMTQSEFAQYMGVRQAMVSKWESGHYNFSIEKVIAIYDKLNLPLNFEPPEELIKRSPIEDMKEFLKKSSSAILNLSKVGTAA